MVEGTQLDPTPEESQPVTTPDDVEGFGDPSLPKGDPGTFTNVDGDPPPEGGGGTGGGTVTP
jgi:hypothetical protein